MESEDKRIKVGISKFKHSLVAGIALTTFGMMSVFMVNDVQASDSESTSSSISNTDSTNETVNQNLQNNATVAKSSTTSSDAAQDTDVNQNAVAKSNSDAPGIVVNATGNTNNVSNNVQRAKQPNVTATSSQNKGQLDSATIEDNNLNVSGWHATNYANGRNYDFVIVYDTTQQKEIARTQVTPSQRNDVATAYPNLEDAANSGFSASFQLTPKMVGDQIQIINRYSADLFGNSDYVDYWSAPIIFDKDYANLDEATITSDGSLSVSGWHAADATFGKDNHFLILYDATTNEQISVTKVNNTKRTDVKNVYPGVYNEDNSGFNTLFNLENVDITHSLKLVSRYSDSDGGNGDAGTYTDYWFSLPKFNTNNFGQLESFDFDGGTQLQVGGWHATNLSAGKSNHFVILFDKTTGEQVASVQTTRQRNDVAQYYTNIGTALDSGFSATFDYTSNLAGHNLVVVSRYSTSSTGNGDSGNYVDYWFNEKTFNENGYSIDHFNVSDDRKTVHVDGWFANDNAIGRDIAYLIVLNTETGREVARQQVEMTQRNDVGSVYKGLYNANMSGFSANIATTSGMSGENLRFILRYSSDKDGNSDCTDIYTDTYQMPDQNGGSFDFVSVDMDAGNVTISGWHAADGSYLKNYEYLIVLNMQGKELERVKVSDSHQLRNDVLSAYPNIYNAQYSGFSANLPITTQMRDKYVKVIDRFTDDTNGNGDYVDLNSGTISIGMAYDVTANAINAYITNNHLAHATIQTQIWSGYPTDESMLYENGYGKPEGVVVHETANYGNDNIPMEMAYAQAHYNNAFVHSYVSDAQIVNVANTDYKCWGSGGQGNKRFVQFEQIEVHSKTAFAYELNNAAYYTAYLLNEYGLTPSLCVNGSGTVWSHHDISTYLGNTDHTDPDGYWATNARKYFGTSYTMNDFFELVKSYFAVL